MPGIGVITNPMTRYNRRNPGLAGQLGTILGERGALEMPGDLDALTATAIRFRDRAIDVLVEVSQQTREVFIDEMRAMLVGHPQRPLRVERSRLGQVHV